MARKIILWSITSNNSSYAVLYGLRGFSLNFLALKHLLLFLGITQQSTSRWIWWYQKDCIIKIQQLTHEKGRSLSNSSARSNCEPHDFIRLRASASVGPESREADGCPSFLEKRDRRERSFFIEKRLTVHADFPLKDIACVLFAQTKDAKIVCVIGCQITRTRIHTLLKRLASARHDNI